MSDPNVQTMNEAQWLFEYHALRAQERSFFDSMGEFFKAFFRELRATLITVFGLNLVKGWNKGLTEEEKEELKDEIPYIPASFLWGRPEAVKAALDEKDKEDRVEEVLGDTAFDEMSARMARGEPNEMDLLLMSEGYDPKPLERKLSLERLERVGVKFVPSSARVVDPLLQEDLDG